MLVSASDIASATGGRLVGEDIVCDGASIDTRTITQGQLFIPVVDARDGHDFIPQALTAGCGAYLTEHDPQGGIAIVVEDTQHALAALGRMARDRHTGPVIGITGSVGKTSVKDLTLAAVRGSRRTHASQKSFNNELGVPLTLLNAPEHTEVLIVEMGARGIGHIAELCEIARPTIGIVTFVGAVHTSEFGTVEVVAQAKRELVEALPPDGRAILNADCAPVLAMSQASDAPVTTYGEDGDVAAHDVAVDDQLRPSFRLVRFGRSHDVQLPVHGVHQVSNALAAIAAAEAVEVPPGDAITGLADAELSPWRMEIGQTTSGATIINDAYNANAISTAAALQSLARLDADRRIAVLGVMAELGDRHDQDHREIADLCTTLGVDLVAYQEPAYGVEPLHDYDAIIARLGELSERDAVLVKGSRVAELETVARRLTEGVS